MKKVKLWQDWVILVTAVWLFISPFVLGFASTQSRLTWFTWILSAFLVASVLEAFWFTDEWGDWLDITIGLALIVTPLTLDLHIGSAGPMNMIGSGTIITVCAIFAMVRDHRTGVTNHHRPENG